jgi:AAA+ ATPase superfamily predicted ATPase
LIKEIEDNPTKLSIEEINPVVGAVQKKVKESLERLYATSMPHLMLRLPMDMESYIPDNNQAIEIQIVVENKMGCSPVESLELIVQEDEDLFKVNISTIRSDESLRGGEQRILKIPLQVTPQTIESQTFSLPVYAQYRSRSEDIKQTPIENFSIRLYAEKEFEKIENPYATYAEGGIVADPEMFYGREELIQNIVESIHKSQAQSKCIVVFGQKRSGKSSILYHLKNRLEKEKNLLVLDLGNIGSILDEYSTAPFLYQILWNILKKLEYAIEDRVNSGFISLNLSFPNDNEFYVHPSPLVLFKDVFDKYMRQASRSDNWRKVRIVVLIDEFSYIYGQIVARRIPESFMKNWKAILQENYFNAVLAGTDVMHKFKQRFPNEFGTTQDERVSYLKCEDAIKLIDEPIRIGGRQGKSRYRERAIDRILDLTAGSPFYIQILCNRLVEYMNRKHAMLVTEADVDHVKNELIRGVNALSLDKFDNLINSGDVSKDAISDEDVLNVLKTIALNSRTGPCNRGSITCLTNLPVDVILDDLVKRNVIERAREQYYQNKVGLFKEWLIANQ